MDFMAPPGGSQGIDPGMLCGELVGLPESLACERIQECGYQYRVAAVGDMSFPLLSDRKPNRVNLWLSDHRVVVRAEAF